jgi:hypothetical protein
LPFTAAVIAEADALEMAHPDPTKLTSAMTSPSMRSQTVSWSPHSGFRPSARRFAPAISPKFRGRRLWSRMIDW